MLYHRESCDACDVGLRDVAEGNTRRRCLSTVDRSDPTAEAKYLYHLCRDEGINLLKQHATRVRCLMQDCRLGADCIRNAEKTAGPNLDDETDSQVSDIEMHVHQVVVAPEGDVDDDTYQPVTHEDCETFDPKPATPEAMPITARPLAQHVTPQFHPSERAPPKRRRRGEARRRRAAPPRPVIINPPP